MKEVLTVFVASSIRGIFETERASLATCALQLNGYREDRYIDTIECELEPQFVAPKGTQYELNEKLRQSDVALFLVGESLGEYTAQELEVAARAFRQAGRPRVVLRFREEFSAQNRALYARCVEEGFDCAYYRETKDLWRWLQSVQEDDALWQ